MMRTIAAAIGAGAEQLRAAGLDSPRLDAEILVRHVLGIDRTELIVQLRDELAPADDAAFQALLSRRLAGAPVAYLTGVREFMGLPFQVGPGVLIPRPETELLVERALASLTTRPEAAVIDVGTGSGAIALSIAALTEGHRIIASDRSPGALRFAERNRHALGLDGRVDLVLADLAEPLGGPIDLLLANLPYLRPDQLAGNPDLDAEPAIALVSGEDGLDLIRRLAADASRFLGNDGAIGLEIDPGQADEVVSIARACFPRARIAMHNDLAGLARHLWIDLN